MWAIMPVKGRMPLRNPANVNEEAETKTDIPAPNSILPYPYQ